MSSGNPIARFEATPIIGELTTALAPYCHVVMPAGSYRRGRQMIGDVEMVVHPHSAAELRTVLDSMVNRREIERGKWGDLYRSFTFRGVPIDLFFADRDNWGYILWLRTGPGDKNTEVMQMMARNKAKVRFRDGYGWRVRYSGEVVDYLDKLAIPDEFVLYKLLGMPYVAPAERDPVIYRRYIGRIVHTPDLAAHLAERGMIQKTLW